ncbi:MAG: serine/threonine-protein kinase [candidate division Zixibacteria bacterium]|nr:serine/threonine-protein kinase [candidate division Zixibacteria bacterium]
MGLKEIFQINTKSAFSDWTKKVSGFILYILITFSVMVLYLDQQDWLEKYNLKFQDLGYKFRGKIEQESDIVILALDQNSLNQYGRWPWSRDTIAQIVEKLSRANPKVLYLDFYLPPDIVEDTSGGTYLLAEAIKNAGNVILPLYFNFSEVDFTPVRYPEVMRFSSLSNIFDPIELSTQLPSRAKEIYYSSQILTQSASALGHSNHIRDLDNKIRYEQMLIGFDGNYYPSVSLQIIRKYNQLGMDKLIIDNAGKLRLGNVLIPTDNQYRLPINYAGPKHSFKYYSASSLLDGSLNPQIFFNKIVLVGLTDYTTSQLKTPVSSFLPAVEKTANLVQNILHKNISKTTGLLSILDFLLLIIIGTFCAFVLPNVNLIQRLVILFVFFFIVLNLNFILFSSFHIITKPFYPLLELFLFIVISPGIKPQRVSKITRKKELEKEISIIKERFIPAEPEPEKTMKLDLPEEDKENSYTPLSSTPAFNPTPLPEEKTSSPVVEKSTSHITLNRLGRYEVIEVIGKGAMGMVYKGIDPAIDRMVALKTIRIDNIASTDDLTELKDRLIKEAKAAGRLSHPNILTIYDVGQEGDLYYIAMEYLEGYTLDRMILKKTDLNYKIVAKIIIQVCEALNFAHENQIVHRDIKPANIMILDSFNIKVMDFGIARFGASSMTQDGIAVGTPSYISPEILEGKPADKRSDIFSLGVVLYEILTGQKPFKGEVLSALIYSILNDQPPLPSVLNDKTPAIFDRIVGKALMKNPEERYQNAQEMQAPLKEFISSFVVTRSFKI